MTQSLCRALLALLTIIPVVVRPQDGPREGAKAQWVYLRRMNAVLFATAMDLRIQHAEGEKGDAQLIVVYPNDSMVRVAHRRWLGEQPLVLIDTIIPGKPGFAYFRFGVEADIKIDRPPRGDPNVLPPAALSPGEPPSLSAPVFIRALAGGDPLPQQPTLALERMSSHQTVPRHTPIGIYFESYGIAPRDSVTILVTVRQARSRVAMVTNRWLDAWPSTGSLVLSDAGVPIVARSFLLDVSHLALGAYEVELAVVLKNGTEVRSSAGFIVK